MSYGTPIVGVNSIVKFTPAGGSEVTLKNSNWSIKPKSMVKEAPNTTDGMLRAAGLLDYEGSVKGHLDTAQPIDQNVTEGTIGVIKLYRDLTHYYSGTVIIMGFSEDTGADDLDNWEFDFAKQSGPLVKPVFP